MVAAAWQRAVGAFSDDLRAFVYQMGTLLGSGRARPGMVTQRIQGEQGRRRLHLRVHGDGSGVLFANVSDVVHLTPLAAEIARMLLGGLSTRQTRKLLRAWYPEASDEQLGADVAALGRIISALREPGGVAAADRAGQQASASAGRPGRHGLACPRHPGEGCPTCLPEFERAPLFSFRAYAPYKADVALTYACNNACAHCYNEPGRRDIPSLDLRSWRRVLGRLAKIGVPHIIFTGGEPTLYEALPALIRCAARLGQASGLNTNGRRLADAGFVRRLAEAGLDHVQITLASHLPAIHNEVVRAPAYEETVQGIRNALAAGLHTITNTTLSRCNREHAAEIVDFLQDLGVTTFAMNGMICAGGGRRNPDSLSEPELIPVLEEVSERAARLGMRFLWYTPTEYCRLSPLALGLGPKSCNAAEYSVCIEPNGDVLPCQSYYQPVGNLLRDDWNGIWNSPLFRSIRMRREHPRAAGLPERCYDCVDLMVCGGGCPLQRAERSEQAVGWAFLPVSA